MRTTPCVHRWPLTWLAGLMLAGPWAASALAGPLTVPAGHSATFNFELRATRELPVPPYSGITFMSGVDAAALSVPGTPVRALWQLWSAPDGTGTLLAQADEQLQLHDLFDAAVRQGVFSVRLTVTHGSLTVDPRASAFRHMSREIGTLFGTAVEPRSARVAATGR